jgi:hypothetical protein
MRSKTWLDHYTLPGLGVRYRTAGRSKLKSPLGPEGLLERLPAMKLPPGYFYNQVRLLPAEERAANQGQSFFRI